jgi:hypothetical protein
MDANMRKQALATGVGQGTTAWDALQKVTDQAIAAKAVELGVADTVKDYNKPTYVRVGNALDLQDTPGWKYVTKQVHTVDSVLALVRGGDGVSPAGSTVEATMMRTLFQEVIDAKRDPNSPTYDPHLDAALTTIGTALDKTTNSDLYDYLFFNKTF